ncbi:MAG: recombinase family protein [Vicinamibacterales bacterium]
MRALLKSLGISLRSVTEPIDDTSTGKLMEGVLAAFAQFEQRRALGTDARGHAGCAGAGTMDVRATSRLSERTEVVRKEPRRRPGTRCAGHACFRGVCDRPIHECSTPSHASVFARAAARR